jgi:hypothetical protein
VSWQIRRATYEDSESILGLIERTPQPGAVTLNFERRPDFFIGAKVTCEQPDVWVAEKTGDDQPLKAVFNIGWRRVWVDGESHRLRYAHDLRIEPEMRGGMLLHRMFRKLRRIMEPGEWMQTVILDENRASMETVGSGRAGLPTYYPYGRIETSLIYTRRKGVTLPVGVGIRQATDSDLQPLRDFLKSCGGNKQFFPVYDLEGLGDMQGYYPGLSASDFIIAEDHRGILGVLGTWDQKGFKQTRVVRYAPGLGVLRHLYNFHSLLRGGMLLPPAGGTFSYLALHSIAIRGNDPEILRLMLDYCVGHFSERYDALTCGFFTSDPLSQVPGRYRRQVLHSSHYLVSFDGDPRERLDAGRIPYVDVARL